MKLARFALTHPEMWALRLKNYSLLNEPSCSNIIGLQGSIEAITLLGNELYNSEITLVDPDYYAIVYDYLISMAQEDNIENILEQIGWSKREFMRSIDIAKGRITSEEDLLGGKDPSVLLKFHTSIVLPFILTPVIINNRSNLKGKILVALPLGTSLCKTLWLSADKELRDMFYKAIGTDIQTPFYAAQYQEIQTMLYNIVHTEQLETKVTKDNISNVIDIIKENYNGTENS
jgi:hypothetical protein